MGNYSEVKVEAPLIIWAQAQNGDVSDICQNLLRIYRQIDNIYDVRLDEKKKKVSQITELLERLDNRDFMPAANLRDICKANALLRRGQIKADALEDPVKDYQTACAILTPLLSAKEKDFPYFLVRLNLGRFFRNMGIYLHRRDYHERALNEFKELLEKLTYDDENWAEWKAYIWLDAAMNLSRTELHLYNIQDAKAHLWMICAAVSNAYPLPEHEDPSISYNNLLSTLFSVKNSKRMLNPNNYSPTKVLPHFKDMIAKLKKLASFKLDGCKSGADILKGYSIQALLQLGIAYRKNQDYATAQRFFTYLLVMYPNDDKPDIRYNVDALNNYALCLRKLGFKASCEILKKDDFPGTKKFPKKYSYAPDSADPAEAHFLSQIMFDASNKSNTEPTGKETPNTVPTEEHLLPTTMKKIYYAILVSLCNGTCAASSICEKWSKGNYWAQDVLKNESGGFYLPIRNRFAMLEMIRSFYKKSESRKDDLKVINELLDILLELNSNDRKIQLLKGQLLQKQGKRQEAWPILYKLYREAPQLSRGTIGLKAYHSLGFNFLAPHQYSQARSIYHKIQLEYPSYLHNYSLDNQQEGLFVRRLMLRDLPAIDVLSAIDEGWCLMNIGEYSEAKKLFEDVLGKYEAQDKDYDEKASKPIARLGRYNELRIRNNLLECALEEYCQKNAALKVKEKQASSEISQKNQLCNIKQKHAKLSKCIETQLNRLEVLEAENAVTARHKGYWELIQKKYEPAMKSFEKATSNRYDDVYAHSGWVQAAYKRFENGENIQNDIIDRLQFISGPYTLQSCSKLSEMVEKIVQSPNTRTKVLKMWNDTLKHSQANCGSCATPIIKNRLGNNLEKRNVLYRSISHLNLNILEQGYSLFEDLKENNAFGSLPPEDQGRILVILYQLYAQVQKFKDSRLYYPDKNDDYEKLVQYRSINHLKRYLKQESGKAPDGRLSLWNTAYMNDDREGKRFLSVFNTVTAKNPSFKKLPIGNYFSKAELRSAGVNGAARQDSSAERPYMSSYENVYTASLSLENDSIPMWIAYADDCKGCTVSYSKDYLNLRKKRSMPTDVSLYTEHEFPLYEVIYLKDPEDNNSKLDTEKLRQDQKAVEDLWTGICILLKKLQNCDAIKGDLLPVVNGFVRSCLSEVRFLVKDMEYAYEQEIRMIHYSKNHRLETEHSPIPRLYINLDREVRLEKIVLGPKVTPYEQDQLETWLMNTGNVEKVIHSERHIR